MLKLVVHNVSLRLLKVKMTLRDELIFFSIVKYLSGVIIVCFEWCAQCFSMLQHILYDELQLTFYTLAEFSVE